MLYSAIVHSSVDCSTCRTSAPSAEGKVGSLSKVFTLRRMLPQFTPMPRAVAREPFDHPDWLYEVKWDGSARSRISTVIKVMNRLHLFLAERGHKFLSACNPTAFAPRLGVDARAETQVLLKGVLHLIDERPIVEADIALFVVGE